MRSDKLPPVMSVGGKVASWVMYAPGFEHFELKKALFVHKLSVMSPAVLQGCDAGPMDCFS